MLLSSSAFKFIGSTTEVESAWPSETSVPANKTTRFIIPNDHNVKNATSSIGMLLASLVTLSSELNVWVELRFVRM
jgi:hypothetical protein